MLYLCTQVWYTYTMKANKRVRIPENLHEIFKAQAEQQGTSIQALAVQAMWKGIEQ